MCGNLALMEIIVADRLAAARAAASEARMLHALRPAREPLRAMLGARLVKLGERLLDAPRARMPANSA